ncbi:MAG: hypothetical protein JWQ19_926 [Subtercola sp.]|nr:hypothetical protein [Subtercola sp.]
MLKLTPFDSPARRSVYRSSRTARLSASVAGVMLAAVALAGCSFNSNVTMSPTDFAKQVSEQFQKQLNVTPIVDCGTAQIDIVEGAVVHCDFSATDSPDVHYDSTTTISNVHGTDFHIDTKVDDHPKQ